MFACNITLEHTIMSFEALDIGSISQYRRLNQIEQCQGIFGLTASYIERRSLHCSNGIRSILSKPINIEIFVLPSIGYHSDDFVLSVCQHIEEDATAITVRFVAISLD